MKVARDALRNLEAIDWCRSFTFTCNPSNNRTKGRPHATQGLKGSCDRRRCQPEYIEWRALGTDFYGLRQKGRCPKSLENQLERGPGEKRCRPKSHASWPLLEHRKTQRQLGDGRTQRSQVGEGRRDGPRRWDRGTLRDLAFPEQLPGWLFRLRPNRRRQCSAERPTEGPKVGV